MRNSDLIYSIIKNQCVGCVTRVCITQTRTCAYDRAIMSLMAGKETNEAETEEYELNFFCPNCFEDVKKKTRLCPHCKVFIEWTVPYKR